MPGRLFLYLQLCKLKFLEACLELHTVRLKRSGLQVLHESKLHIFA